MKKNLLIYLLIFFSCICVAAERPVSKEFDRAKLLYRKKQFIFAAQLFERIAKDTDNDRIKFKSYYNAGLACRIEADNSSDTEKTGLYLRSFQYFKDAYPFTLKDKKPEFIMQLVKILNADFLVSSANYQQFEILVNFYESILNQFSEKLYIQSKLTLIRQEIGKSRLQIADKLIKTNKFDTAITQIDEIRKENPFFYNIDFKFIEALFYKYEENVYLFGFIFIVFIVLFILTAIAKRSAKRKSHSLDSDEEQTAFMINAAILEKHQRKYEMKMRVLSLFSGFSFVASKIIALDRNRISEIYELCQKNRQTPELAAPIYEYLFSLGWEKPDEYFELAEMYLALKLTDSAVRTLIRIKLDKLTKDQLLAYYMTLAELYQRSGNLSYAARQLENALKLAVNVPEIYQRIADLNAMTKNYQKAADIYFDCYMTNKETLPMIETKLELLYCQVEDKEDRKRILQVAENIFIDSKNDLKLLEVYVSLNEIEPDNIQYMTKLGKVYLKLDMLEPAYSVFKRREELAPADIKLKKALAIIALETGKKDDEIKYLLTVFFSDEQLEQERTEQLISYLKEKNDFENLYSVYLKIIETTPDNSEILKNFINTLINSKKIIEFMEYIKLLVLKYPEEIDFAEDRIELVSRMMDDKIKLYKLKIEIYSISDRLSKVEEYYEKMLNEFPNEPLLEERVAFATILKESGREKDSIKIFEKIIAFDQANTEYLRTLGGLYLNQKMLREAKEIFENIIKINSDDAAAKQKLEDLENIVKNEQLMKFQDLLNDEDTPLDKRFEIQYNLANEYFQSGFYKLCVDELKSIIKRGVKNNEYHYKSISMLINTYIAQRQTGVAIQYLGNIYNNQELNADEQKLIKYLLAVAYIAHDDKPKAKALLEELAVSDDNYKDISRLLDNLSAIKSSSEGLITSQTSGHHAVAAVKKSTLERYEIIKELGRGGMGVVYKARDLKLDRIVALKQLPQNTDANSEAAKRLFLEAKAAAKLSHPNILNVYDVGDSKDELYISMEFIEGKTLTDIVHAEDYSFNIDYIRAVSIQICAALDYAHSNDIIHRDIKPDNIMLTPDNKIKIMDFGLAKRSDIASTMTQDGIAMGTAQYMSPEQIKGDNIDNRTDIYAFGCMLYEMIVKTPPFNSTNINALIYKHLSAKPQSLKTLNQSVPDSIEKIVFKCLEKDREKRYFRANEIIEDINKIV